MGLAIKKMIGYKSPSIARFEAVSRGVTLLGKYRDVPRARSIAESRLSADITL